LNTFLFDWKIKARVTKKHQMRNYTNARGPGHILKIELIDNQGTQIEGTFFNEQALTNNSTLEENKVYLISGG
jgi:replication factor A1